MGLAKSNGVFHPLTSAFNGVLLLPGFQEFDAVVR